MHMLLSWKFKFRISQHITIIVCVQKSNVVFCGVISRSLLCVFVWKRYLSTHVSVLLLFFLNRSDRRGPSSMLL